MTKIKKILAEIIALALLIGIVGIVVWVGFFIYGIVHAIREDSKDYPGKAQFVAENDKINVFGGRVAFGNTPEATAIADEFSKTLQVECQALFTGGSKLTPATAGHFLTYCRVTTKSVVILCQVPDLRGYRDDVRDELAKVAWGAGQAAAEKGHVDPQAALVVGLRGFGSYGPIWEGKLTGDASTKGSEDDLNGEKRLYPYFIPPDQTK